MAMARPGGLEASVAGSVLTVGSLMLDTTIRVPDGFPVLRGLAKGNATRVANAGKLKDLAAAALEAAGGAGPQAFSTALGGCAVNTAKALVALGIPVAHCGAVGSDAAAGQLRQALVTHGIGDESVAHRGNGDPPAQMPSGEVLCLVTPDSERTFAYNTGVSALRPTSADLCLAIARAASTEVGLGLVYFDVYSLHCPGQLLEDGLRAARSHGALTGLNLGSSGMVEESRDRLWAALNAGLVDVLTLNAAEACALCLGLPAAGDADSCRGDATAAEADLALVRPHCRLVVLTLGADGVWVAGKDEAPSRFAASRLPVGASAVDSTGAGDYFAGGFLAGFLRGLPSELCARWGAESALAIIQKVGVDLEPSDWGRLGVCVGRAK